VTDDVAPPAPLVLRSVRVGSGGRVADVRVAGGRIAAVGTAVEQPGDRFWHEPGAVLLPGFVDAHVHATQWASDRTRVDVSSARSPEEAADLLRAAVAALPQPVRRNEWVVGRGFRDALWTQPPHRELLESALPGIAVAVVSHDLHAVRLSPAGLARTGHVSGTGLLREREALEATTSVDSDRCPRLVDRWVATALDAAAARGITGVVDYEFADNHTDWMRRIEADDLAVRVRAGVWRPWLGAALDRGLRTGEPVPGSRGQLEVGWFKVIADGSLNTRTAFCHDPYPDQHGPDRHGVLLVPEDELVELMTRASAGGLSPAVHAIGDAANSLVLNAFERVDCPGRIEHAQLVSPGDARRFARPGLVASVQPQHAVADRDVADTMWASRTAHAFPYASLLAAGARLVLGSDAPVSEPAPLQAVADAVRRSDDDRPPWHPEQAIGLSDALAAASGGRRGSAVGDRADLVLLGADPALVPAQDLPQIPVLATLLGGRFTAGNPG